MRWTYPHDQRLGYRDQRTAAQALQDSKQDQHVQAGREAAKRRKQGKTEHRGRQYLYNPKPVGKPAGHRNGESLGDGIRRDDPGAFAWGGRERISCDMGHGNVDDRGIQDDDKSRQGEDENRLSQFCSIHRGCLSLVRHLSRADHRRDAANRRLASVIGVFFRGFANPLNAHGISGNFIAWSDSALRKRPTHKRDL